MLIDEFPARTKPDSIVNQSMLRYTREAEHRALAAEMWLWEIENKVKVYPIGATSVLPEEKKNDTARESAHKVKAEKKPRSGKKSNSGHQNIAEHKTCWSFSYAAKYIKSFRFDGDKQAALVEAITYRDKYRKDNCQPPAEY